MTQAAQLATYGSNSVGLSFKNRIINGAMMIDQRNAGASVTPTDSAYTLDRWRFRLSQTAKLTTQQNAGSATPPVGFVNYLGITSSSAYSVLSGDYFVLEQAVEGFNVADLGWGTVNAQSVTISFWVKSSLTGTFGGSVRNATNDRCYPFSYTVSSTGWEQKTVTISGDTSGTWVTTNGQGMKLSFGLGVGSTYSGTAGSWSSTYYFSATGATSVVGTNGATFYITGVQLEKGSTATSFDYRPYGTELALCQRYFVSIPGNEPMLSGRINNGTSVQFSIPLTTTLRATPGITIAAGTANVFTTSGGYTTTSTTITTINEYVTGVSLQIGGFTGPTDSTPACFRPSGRTISISAEL